MNTDGRAQSHMTSSRSRFVGTTEKPVEGEGKKKGCQGYFRLSRGGEGGTNLFIKKFSGVSSLIARYISRGIYKPRWVKQLNSRVQTIYVKQ